MSFVAQRPITESNRPPSYQASTSEPESNRHFLCWWPVPISGYALRSMPRGPRLLIRVLSNRRHSYAVDSPTLNPCVTRAGFRHLRTRHRLTTQLRAVKSHPRFPAATEIPEVRYCAQGFNVGPRYFPGVVRVQRLRPLCLRVAPWLHRPGRVFHLPIAGLYFANIEPSRR